MPYLSVYKEILEAVKVGIVALNLPELPTGNIQVKRLGEGIENHNPGFGCVIISPVGSEAISNTEGTNERDDIGYPVLIRAMMPVPASAEETSETDYDDLSMYWRQEIRKKFINQRLGTVAKVNTLPGVHTCIVEPRDVMIPQVFRMRGIHESHLVLRFKSRETRG